MIKWFCTRHMSNSAIPQIDNVQGSLNSVLNHLLVDGYNVQTVSSVSSVSNEYTLVVGEQHGFVKYAVVIIDSVEYRIADILSDAIILHSANDLSNTTSVKYAPLGWSASFTIDNGTVFKSNSALNKFYFRLNDNKLSGTNASAAKFATVELCSGMSDFDNADEQTPYDSAYPLQNRETISGRSNGWFKWYYSSSYSTNAETSSQSPDGNKHYTLIGDENGFYLICYPDNNTPVLYSVHYTQDNMYLGATNGYTVYEYNVRNILGGYSYSLSALFSISNLPTDGRNYKAPSTALVSYNLPTSKNLLYTKPVILKDMYYNMLYDILPNVYVSESNTITEYEIFNSDNETFMSFVYSELCLLFRIQ